MPRRRRGRNSKSEDIVELDDLPKVTLLGETSVNEDNVSKTQHEEASIISCPSQSASRAEFQEINLPVMQENYCCLSNNKENK